MVDSLDCAKPACYTSTCVSVRLTGKDVNSSVSVPLVYSIMNLYKIGHIGDQYAAMCSAGETKAQVAMTVFDDNATEGIENLLP